MNPIDFKSKFEWKSYIGRYHDLKNCPSLELAWNHANNFGWKENRTIFADDNIQKAFITFKKTGVMTLKPNDNKINQQLVEKGINMYNLNNLADADINEISKNVHGFSDQIKPYNKILFISGDYPGYGGAATNCYELQKYFKTLGHTTFGFYFNYETGKNPRYEKHEDHIIDDVCNFKSVKFKPDLIILKSPINMELKSLFKCPIYFLVGGVYKNNLDKYYYDLESKKENDQYINKDVLNHILKCDQSFVNSQHTADILKKFYDVSTNIFYSSFVPYVDKKVLIDPDFEKRKYDYGLIVSNFERKIKNVEKSVEFLKGKENVILIGKGSERYKSYGFTCIDLVDKEEMNKYYKQIKYIVQDSFYESCSNVKIEGLFNGCNIYNNYYRRINVNTITDDNERMLNVVFCCDSNYMYYAMFALNSCIHNSMHNDKIRYTFCVPIEDINLCENFLSEIVKINQYTLNVFIYGIDVGNVLVNLKLNNDGGHLNSKGNYLRLTLNSILPYTNYVYIDSDDIVMKDIYTSIKSLNINDDIPLYGRKSESFFGVIINKKHHGNVNKLLGKKIDLERKIVNTGTYYVNCKRANELFMTKKCNEIYDIHIKNDLFRCFTMSIINLGYYDNYEYFDESKFNCVIDLGWKKDLTKNQLDNATVLEWSGNKKPWKSDGLYKEYWYPYFPLKLKKSVVLIISHPLNSVGGSQNFINYVVKMVDAKDSQIVCCYKYKKNHKTSYLKFNLNNEVLFDFINNNNITSIIFNNSIWFFNDDELKIFDNLDCKKKIICHNEYSPAIKYLDKMNFSSVISVNKSITHKLNNIDVNNIIPVSIYIDDLCINKNKKFIKSFAFIGRIDKYKGIDILLKVFHELTCMDEEYKLYIISPINDDNVIYQNLLKLVNDLGINNHIVFTGKKTVPELIEFCKTNVNCVISSSITEGYPVICHESIQMSCPIVSSNVGGFKDFVNEFNWGYLVDLEKYYEKENILDIKYTRSFDIFHEVAYTYETNLIKEFVKTIQNINQDKYTSLLKNFDVDNYITIMKKNENNIIEAFTH